MQLVRFIDTAMTTVTVQPRQTVDVTPKGDTGGAGTNGTNGTNGSDATVIKSAVEAVLTGEISSHTHPKISQNYIAYLSQTGTNAPTEDIVLKDNFSVPVWSYSAVGIFLLTKAGAFATANKCVPNKITPFTDAVGNYMTLERTSADVMTLKTYAAADTTVLANGVLSGQYLNIEVYL